MQFMTHLQSVIKSSRSSQACFYLSRAIKLNLGAVAKLLGSPAVFKKLCCALLSAET